MRVRDSFADLDEQFQPFPSLQPLLIAVIGDRHTWHVLHHKVMATTFPSWMPRSPEYHGEAGSVDDVLAGDDETEGGSWGLG